MKNKPKNFMQTKITIRNEAQRCYIDIEGTIGVAEHDQFEGSSSSVATFETFRREVARIAEVAATQVVVNIRSTGGDVNDALLIYDALKALDARITTRCYGYTASAATIIAQAADKGCREISSNAMYLIHKSTCSIDGNAEKLDSRAELLRKTDERLAQLYALSAGGEVEKYTKLMAENNGEGRWLTAEETVAEGLADKIIDNHLAGVEIPDSEQGEFREISTAIAEQSEAIATNEELPLAKAGESEVGTKQETRKVIGRVAHAIIRYLLSRVAYRWDEWMDRLEEKQIERAKQKEAEKEQKRAAKKAKEAAKESATADLSSTSAEVASTGVAVGTEGGSEGGSLPQDSMPSAKSSRSLIGLSEGQRKVGATTIKPTEDPSMTRLHSYANEKAYDEDAKMFSR